MEEQIVSFLSSVDLSFPHTSTGGILIGLGGIVLIAVVAYLIYRLAIFGLKIASVSAAVYFLVLLAQPFNHNSINSNNKETSMDSDPNKSMIGTKIRGLLETSKDTILPLFSSMLSHKS